MPARKPTHAQAQLQLQLYDLRREPKLRQAREWFFENYFADSLEEANRLTPLGSEQSAYARVVTSYWDQACALLNYGLLHEDLFFETTGEFFGVWEQLKPIVPELRRHYDYPHFYVHLEKAAKRYEKWMNRRAPRWIESMRQLQREMRVAKAPAKST